MNSHALESVGQGARSDPCGPIAWVSLAAADLDRSVTAYQAAFGLTCTASGTVEPDLAAHWQAPALTGCRWALLSAGGAAAGALQLVETGDADAAPLASLGWAAAELSVTGADAVQARALAAGFVELGAVRQLGSTPAIRAGQVAGPEGAAIYVTDVAAYAGALDLSAATDGGACFIAVLATADLEADRDWLEAEGVGRRITDGEVAVPVLQERLGLADGETTRISSLQLAGGCLIEIDLYPARAPRRATACGWPAGAAMLTLIAPGVDGAPRPEAPYDGRRARVDRLPGGAFLERVAL